MQILSSNKIKISSVTALFLFFCTILSAQPQFVKKNIPIPGSILGVSRDLVQLHADTFLIMGITGEMNNSIYQNRLTVAAVNKNGDYLWHKSYGDKNHTYLPTLFSYRMLRQKGAFVYATMTVTDTNGVISGILLKFNHAGDTVWQAKYTAPANQQVFDFSFNFCKDGGFLMVGTHQTDLPLYNGHPIVCAQAQKLDSLGQQKWAKQYCPNDLDAVLYGLDIIENPLTKDILIAGCNKDYSDVFGVVIELDSLGIEKNRHGSAASKPFMSYLSNIIFTKDSNYIAVGGLGTNETLYTDYNLTYSGIIKFDRNLNIIYKKLHDTLSYANGYNRTYELNNGNILVSGTFDALLKHMHGYNAYARISLLNSNGDVIWRKYYDNVTDPDNLDSPFGMIVTNNSEIAFTTGVIQPQINPVYFTFYHTDLSACDPNAIGCYATAIETFSGKLLFTEISPNPATDKLFIKLKELPTSGLSCKIFNQLGASVLSFETTEQNFELNTSSLSNGIYFLQVSDLHGIKGASKITIAR